MDIPGHLLWFTVGIYGDNEVCGNLDDVVYWVPVSSNVPLDLDNISEEKKTLGDF